VCEPTEWRGDPQVHAHRQRPALTIPQAPPARRHRR